MFNEVDSYKNGWYLTSLLPNPVTMYASAGGNQSGNTEAKGTRPVCNSQEFVSELWHPVGWLEVEPRKGKSTIYLKQLLEI